MSEHRNNFCDFRALRLLLQANPSSTTSKPRNHRRYKQLQASAPGGFGLNFRVLRLSRLTTLCFECCAHYYVCSIDTTLKLVVGISAASTTTAQHHHLVDSDGTATATDTAALVPRLSSASRTLPQPRRPGLRVPSIGVLKEVAI